MKGKNNAVEALRFFFMLMICMWHEYATSGIFKHGYLAVEFFFILSGMLLFRSATKENALGTIDYTLKKIRRFAPEYLIVMVFCYLRHGILPAVLGHRSFDVDFVLRAMPESLMLQNTGVFEGGGKCAPVVFKRPCVGRRIAVFHTALQRKAFAQHTIPLISAMRLCLYLQSTR